MASSAAKIRIVRCPKCLKLLTEFADVPVYMCGGCRAVLRAKHHNATGGIASRDSQEVSKLRVLSGSGSSNNVTVPTETQLVSGCLSQRTLGVDFEADENCQKNHGLAQNAEKVDANAEFSLEKEAEKPPELGRQDSSCSKVSEKLKKSEDSVSQSISSDEDMIINRIQAYDGSVSSNDDGSRGQGLNKFLGLSRRTFRCQRAPDSACGKTEQEMNDLSSDAEEKIEGNRQFELNSSNEGHNLASKGSFHSNGEDLSSKYANHAHDREASIDSQEFYSVQNWLESEKDGHSRTMSRDSALIPNTEPDQNVSSPTKFKCFEHDRLGLDFLKKVNELRNQLSGLSDQKVKQSTYFNNTASIHNHYTAHQIHPCPDLDLNHNAPRVHCRNHQFQFSRTHHISGQSCCSCPNSLPLHSCCHCGLYQVCPHDIGRHSSELSHSHSFKEKKLTAKRHCRPMSGGAPFVICTKCFAVLQLPADFLILKRKLQKLRCGSCSEVLVFTFHVRACAVAMPPKEAVHPPSEVEDSAGVLSRSKVSSDCIQGDPVSFTEEYGLSFDQSYSTEVEPGLHVSRKNSVEAGDMGARLHKLMGYHSARELLNKRSYSIRPEKMESRMLYNHSAGEASPDFIGSRKEDESPNRLRIRRVHPQLQGIVKKGMRGLNYGFESLKLKVPRE